MRQHGEPTERLKLVEAVEHGIAATRVGRSAVNDVQLRVEVLQVLVIWQIAEQVSLGRRKLHCGNNKNANGLGGCQGWRDSIYLIVVSDRDNLQPFFCCRRNDCFWGSARILDVVTSGHAMYMQIGANESCSSGQTCYFR